MAKMTKADWYPYEAEHIDTLEKYGAECTVLLKKNGAFPLGEPCRVALYGSGARRTLKGGTGSGDVYSRYYTTAEEGLENAGFTVTTKDWLSLYDAFADARHREFARKLRLKIKKAGVPGNLYYSTGAIDVEKEYEFPLDGDGECCVYVLARLSGEGTDRTPTKGDLLLTDGEVRDILALNKKFKKFILVLNVCGVVDLTPVKDVGNILVLSQLGVPTGDILASVLLGNSPSGKLTTTWTTWEDYQTIGEFGDVDETRYNEGIYVGYRYFETLGKKPLFPFGYGLTYSEFETRFVSVTADKSKITVTADVKNVGKYAAKEVAELYLSCPWGRFDKPAKELAAYAKTRLLAPNESERLTLTFDLTAHSTFDEKKAAYLLEAGDYVLSLGGDSHTSSPVAVVTLDGEADVRRVKNVFPGVDFEDYIPEKPAMPKTDGLVRIALRAADIKPEVITYGRQERFDRIEPFVNTLSDEELILLCIGHYNREDDTKDPGLSVCGCVGETTKNILDKFNQTLMMADGPAGIRMTRELIVTKNEIFDVFGHELDWLVETQPYKERRRMIRALARRPKGKHIYQYTTAIPIATAVAQSWNPEVAEAFGDLVGDELERFGINVWLAPALNIHRTVLCGRNFEYYSEDPLVSGITATAITRGVMKHPGRTTTIKHFACNNQEFNRFGNNSHVSERTIREIYLRGFEYAVKNSPTKAVMTTYNLLNGLHTCERQDLCYDVLRCEWGFEGMVMTDWAWTGGNDVGNTHRGFVCSEIFNADNDLMMPGRNSDFLDAKKALEEGRLTRERLLINASRVYRVITSLGGTPKKLSNGGGRDFLNDRESAMNSL